MNTENSVNKTKAQELIEIAKDMTKIINSLSELEKNIDVVTSEIFNHRKDIHRKVFLKDKKKDMKKIRIHSTRLKEDWDEYNIFITELKELESRQEVLMNEIYCEYKKGL